MKTSPAGPPPTPELIADPRHPSMPIHPAPQSDRTPGLATHALRPRQNNTPSKPTRTAPARSSTRQPLLPWFPDRPS